MKASILHLSDIHFSTITPNPILSRTEAIVSAVSSQSYGDNIIIVVTGDIAFSGKREEYLLAQSFFEDLQLGINQRTGILPSLVMIPGNHDCDFTLSGDKRESELNCISDSVIEQRKYDLGTSVQVEYNRFASNNESTFIRCGEGMGYEIYQIKTPGGESILFRKHNTSWMSRNPEKADIVLPVVSLPSDQTAELLNADLTVAIMHHTFSWLRPACSRKLRNELLETCDIVLTGHEHEPDGYQNIGYHDEITEYREGGVLQSPNDPKVSNFNLICIDTENELINIHQYILKAEIYSALENSSSHKFTRNTKRLKKMFSISGPMCNRLQDLEIVFKHPYKSSLYLDDLFIYPEYHEISYPGDKAKSNTIREASLNLLNEANYVYFAGPEKSGKTMFSKRLFLDLHAQGIIPLLAKGKIFKKADDTYVRTAIIELINEQYSKEAIEPYLQLKRSERAIIIDDYNETNLRGKQRDALLRQLLLLFDKIILFGHNDSRWEELYQAAQSKEPSFDPMILSFMHYEFVELGPIKRSELVSRWHQASALGEFDPDEVHRKSIEAEEIISVTIGKNLIPSYPLFILLLIQQLESRDAATTAHGAQGYLYESLITKSLVETSDYVADLDIKYKYLSDLAYTLFNEVDHAIATNVLEKWHFTHCEKYLIHLDYTKLITTLIRARILKQVDGRYLFVYPYMRYYFTARHLRDNIDSEESKVFIQKLACQLHWQEAANILIFIAYLCKDAFVLDTIIDSAKKLFSDTPLFDYSAPPEFLTKLEGSRAKLILQAMNLSKARRDELLIKEKIEREQREGDVDESEERMTQEGISIINSVTSATKTVQILGQILRSYPGSLSAVDKVRIARECYDLSLRVTGFCISFVGNYVPTISEALVKLATTLHPGASKEILEQESKLFMYRLCERMSFGMIKYVSGALGLEELAPVFRKLLDDNNSRSYEIIDLSIKLDHYQHFPKVEAITVYEELDGVIFARDIVRSLVWYHMHMFAVPYDIRQSVCNKLDIQQEPRELLHMGHLLK